MSSRALAALSRTCANGMGFANSMTTGGSLREGPDSASSWPTSDDRHPELKIVNKGIFKK